MLENIYYSTVMKSHGVKPVRVTIESQRPTANAGDDYESQERDFEPDEEAGRDDWGMAGRMDEPAALSEDELGLSPSFLKTSSATRDRHNSSQPSDEYVTDQTSVIDEEELPSIENIYAIAQPGLSRPRKRLASSRLTPPRKRFKRPARGPSNDSPEKDIVHDDVWQFSLSPAQPTLRSASVVTPPGILSSLPAGASNQQLVVELQARASPVLSLPEQVSTAPVVDLTLSSSTAALDEQHGTASDSSDSAGGQIVRRNGRRIKGVLPASWLRLDHNIKKQAKSAVQPPRTQADHEPKRGVAVRRYADAGQQRSSTLPSDDAFLLGNTVSDEHILDSDDARFDDRDEHATRHFPRQIDTEGQNELRTRPNTDLSDDLSDMEDDDIDRMEPRHERSLDRTRRADVKRRFRSGHVFKGAAKPYQRQPKITSAFVSAVKPRNTVLKRSGKTHQHSAVRQHRPPPSKLNRSPAPKAPRLSILDQQILKPPAFIRIAARTARRRNDLGRSSPSKKHIRLASRIDNVESSTTLSRWEAGRLQPRITGVLPRPPPRTSRNPLEVVSGNALHGKATRQPNTTRSDRIAYRALAGRAQNLDAPHNGNEKSRRAVRRPIVGSSTRNIRLAQLEMPFLTAPEDGDNFRSGKRALDAVFQGAEKDTLSAPFLDRPDLQLKRLSNANDRLSAALGGPRASASITKETILPNRIATARRRKAYIPRYIDLTAAQFQHVDDLPPSSPSDARNGAVPVASAHVLNGLGPYGSHYTNTFDVFPLVAGVYFHADTLMGSRRLAEAVDPCYAAKLSGPEDMTTYQLGEQTLSWGDWTDKVSSELGILVDWLADSCGTAVSDSSILRDQSTVVSAADCLLDYVLHSLRLRNDQSFRSYMTRLTEVVHGFCDRTGAHSRPKPAEPHRHDSAGGCCTIRVQVEVITRIAVVVLSIYKVAGGSPHYAREEEGLAGVLRKLVEHCISLILDFGVDDLLDAYSELQILACRERGLRDDKWLLAAWTAVMKVLEIANMPRTSFWDVLHSAWTSRSAIPDYDVTAWETLWRTLFALLPLADFDASGLLVPGSGRGASGDGWSTPQALVKRLLEAYKANERQPVGFNDYTRSVTGRCFMLVKHWGWHRSGRIIGTLFDFFGSQDFHHLRNEEVYRSPAFLEELHLNPTLEINAEDRCFHIFLKLLALSIKRLRAQGMHNDIKNLIARTLPNHDRQYLKEDTVRQHDLAALRNHHDLLCTLFWASPLELRPPVQLIEKLVDASSSHQQACLISIRAWGQLSRFIVAGDEPSTTYQSFLVWQNNVFNRSLDQYLMVEEDIQQQLRALPKEAALSLEDGVISGMIRTNKAAILDILHALLRSCLDVLDHSRSLQSATRIVNLSMIEAVFARLDYTSLQLDWSIPLVALDILERYQSLVDKASEEHFSSGGPNETEAAAADEARLLLEHKLSGSFFPWVRSIMALHKRRASGANRRARVAEKAVELSAKMVAGFAQAKMLSVQRCFAPGKFGVFGTPVTELSSPSRTFLPLFISTLLKCNVFTFGDIGAPLLGIWMLAVTKPASALSYEDYMAAVLKCHGFPYLQNVFVPHGVQPEYDTNRDYFYAAILFMRQSLLLERNALEAKVQRQGYAHILSAVMQSMKKDIKLLRINPGAESSSYVAFVQEIIGMIKSHGVNICAVDHFFTEPSADYSPPALDPRLHAAGIVAYGIRLAEGESTASPQLFHYLYQNFKIALTNGKLEDECAIVCKAMRHPGVLSFVVSQMLPSIILAMRQNMHVWPLLGLFAAATTQRLGESCLPPEIIDKDGVIGIRTCICAGLTLLQHQEQQSQPQHQERAGSEDLQRRLSGAYVALHLMRLFTAFQPSLATFLLLPATPLHAEVQSCVQAVQRFAAAVQQARSPLDEGIMHPSAIELTRVFRSASEAQVPQQQVTRRVDEFTRIMVADVTSNWVASDEAVALRPAASASPRAGPGVQRIKYLPWDMSKLIQELHLAAGRWKLRSEECGVEHPRRRGWAWRCMTGRDEP
jgi:hypothetical protein